MFHEVLVLLGFLAGVTRDLELVTSVVIAPQRQTALLAKQAAEVDVLSGGRLRLGLGLGWNDVEYEALGRALPRPRPPHGGADRAHAPVVAGTGCVLRR